MATQLTHEQVEGRKEKAERFLRTVLGDDERADEVAAESAEDYARRHFEIINPKASNTMAAKKNPTVKDLQDRIVELEDENQDLSDQLDAIADIVGSDDDDDSDSDDDQD